MKHREVSFLKVNYKKKLFICDNHRVKIHLEVQKTKSRTAKRFTGYPNRTHEARKK